MKKVIGSLMGIVLYLYITLGSMAIFTISILPLYRFLLHLFGGSLFSFLSMWLVVYFVDLFKKPALGFIDFLKGFLCVYLLQFCSDLSYFLSSARF